MSLFSFKNVKPQIAKNCYIAPGSQIIGQVEIGEESSVWHNCVLRADVNKITIGSKTNIQDLSILHVTEQYPLVIGDNVTIGHNVTLHGCTIGHNALIGMGAVILDMAQIGSFSIVAAGSTVTPGKIFPPKSMIMGSPAKVVRELKDEEIKMLERHYLSYVGYAKEFADKNTVTLLESF